MSDPKSTLVDVIAYLKSDEDFPGTPTSTGDVKELSKDDREELRASLDTVRASK